MTVQELQKLLNGEYVSILDGKGKISIDFEFNTFLAFIDGDFLLNVHETLEEAIEEIREWEEE